MRLMASIPLSTPSASTHWQWLHNELVAFGVQTWQALRTHKRAPLFRFGNVPAENGCREKAPPGGTS